MFGFSRNTYTMMRLAELEFSRSSSFRRTCRLVCKQPQTFVCEQTDQNTVLSTNSLTPKEIQSVCLLYIVLNTFCMIYFYISCIYGVFQSGCLTFSSKLLSSSSVIIQGESFRNASLRALSLPSSCRQNGSIMSSNAFQLKGSTWI